MGEGGFLFDRLFIIFLKRISFSRTPSYFFSRVSSFTTFLLFFIYLSLSPQYINIDVDKKREERIEQSLRA